MKNKKNVKNSERLELSSQTRLAEVSIGTCINNIWNSSYTVQPSTSQFYPITSLGLTSLSVLLDWVSWLLIKRTDLWITVASHSSSTRLRASVHINCPFVLSLQPPSNGRLGWKIVICSRLSIAFAPGCFFFLPTKTAWLEILQGKKRNYDI